MGTTCDIKYRHGGETGRIWVADPGHPIADGLDECFEIPSTEMYGEPYDVPEPDRTVFISWFEGGEVFRSGVCYRRGRGRIFAFRPGHEEYPIFHQAEVQRVIGNAVVWAAPNEGATVNWGYRAIEPLDERNPELSDLTHTRTAFLDPNIDYVSASGRSYDFVRSDEIVLEAARVGDESTTAVRRDARCGRLVC